MKKMRYEEEKKIYVSFSGSYCRTCDWFTGKIGKTAIFPCQTLRENPGVIKFHTIENLQEMRRIGTESWIKKQLNLY